MSPPTRLLVLSLALLSLASCFQAQLHGPVSGARIVITHLRDTTTVLAEIKASSRLSEQAEHGEATWASFGPVGRLWNMGTFEPGLDPLRDDRLYLVTARGGSATDLDLDGMEDARYTPVRGTWHAIVSGAQLRAKGPQVSPLTEAAYQWLHGELQTLSDAEIRHNLNRAAPRLVNDVTDDGLADNDDLLHWNRLFDRDKLLADDAQLVAISQHVIDSPDEAPRRAMARRLVGLDIARCPPDCSDDPAEALAAQLWGLPLDDLIEQSYRALLLRNPQTVFQLGLAADYGLTTLHLDDVSDAYEARTAAMVDTVHLALEDIDASTLDARQQLNLTLYRYYLEDRQQASRFTLYDYPASAFITGVPSRTEFFFSDILPLDTSSDALLYLRLLGEVADTFRALRTKVATRVEAGVVEPRITLNLGIDRLRAVSGTRARSTNYYRRLALQLDDIPGFSSERRAEILADAEMLIREFVQPAYQQLADDLEALREGAPQDIGVGQFVGGDDYYAWTLRHHTTTRLTAEQIHRLGERELRRVHGEIRRAAAAEGIDAQQWLPLIFNEAASRGGFFSGPSILAEYERLVTDAEQRLPEAFLNLPRQDVVVIGGQTGGFYVGGSDDGSRPGAFYAATVGEEPYYLMPSLAYHEAVPGHHLQIALAQEQDLPDFRRHARFTGYVEGWALYAERLAFELGWYDADPWGNLGRLQFEAIRAARLVVDTGIHHYGWSWNQAVDYYRDNTGSSVGAAQGAVARFMRWPGQATAYMVGMLELLALREAMERSQGTAYTVTGFHDAVLLGGALPLTVLADELAED